MCIHNEYDVQAYNKILTHRESPTRVLSLRASSGRLIGAWPVVYSDSQKIANTIRDVKDWHSEDKDVWVDLSLVNEARVAGGLGALDRNGLPFAIGEALPQDMDVDLVIRGRDDFTEFERGLKRYMKAQEAQLVEVGA